MVSAERLGQGADHCVVIRPNAALSPRHARQLLAAVGVAMALIGGGFASLGLWPVLPFSGLEWIALAYCFRLTLRRCSVREVITVTEHAVTVERGSDRLEPVARFARPWVVVQCVKGPRHGYPNRLTLRLRGTEVEVGRFLAEDERQLLLRCLREILDDNSRHDPHRWVTQF